MKVTKEDIRSIKVGTSVTFQVTHPRQINSVKTMAYQIRSTEPELKKKFSCVSDYKNRKVTITANSL